MGEPKTMTAEDALDRDDVAMYARNTEVPWTPKLKAAVTAAALRAMDDVDDLDRQIRRLRLELACERREEGPWTALGWRLYDDWSCLYPRRFSAPRTAALLSRSWFAYSDDGENVIAQGSYLSRLDGIEQACDALGIPTPWERAT